MDLHHHHAMMDTVQTKPPNVPTTKKSLGLLAEVAITRLIEEQKNEAMTSKTKIVNKNYSLKQIRKLSEKKLLMTFAEHLKSVVDKNQKLFSYKCQILPQECQFQLECYGSEAADENEIKTRMIDHLMGHLCNLEMSVPNIKISSSRKVRSRNRTAKVKPTAKATAKPSTTTQVTARKGTTTKKATPESAAPITIQSVITSTATPIDMTTSSSAAPTVSASPLMDDKKLLVLKFLEEDHSYTNITAPPPPPPSQSTTTDPHYRVLNETFKAPSEHQFRVILPETTDLASIQHHHQQQQQLPHHASVITSTPNIVSQTVEIRTSQNVPPPPPQSSSATPILAAVEPIQSVVPASLTQGNIRALALDYIDDIRKKSSSAAKSVIVNGDKSLIYQCKICPDKQFTSTNGLIFHYKKHAGLKPYVCELCSATFTRQHSLNYHMLIHLNKSRFVCSECGRHFRHPSHFKEHMRRHTGETPFQCGDCLIRFKTRNTYKRHLQTKHAKILTSKGIIELSSAVSYQSVPKVNTTTVAGPTGTVAVSNVVATPIAAQQVPGPLSPTVVAPVSGAAIIRPRRKYGIRFLHKNIETISKYEQQQIMPQTQVPIDYSQHAQSLTIQGHHGQHVPGASNITILSIPHLAGVHILDNATAAALSPGAAARIGKPLVDLTDNVNYQHSPTVSQAITLVPYQSSQLEPIQPTTVVTSTSIPISSGQLTELISSPAAMVHAAGSASALVQQHGQPLQPQPTTNDNFMRLLEAIALTEDA